MKSKTLPILLGIIFYIFLINQLPSILNFSSSSNNTQINDPNINFADSVQTSITRPRWYGTIYEGENYLKFDLFNQVPLPIFINFSYIYIHAFFIVIMAYLILKGGENGRKH